MKTPLVLFSIIFSLQPAFAIDYFDWQSNITNSCKATISGRAKSLFSTHGFWFDTGVSMEMWAGLMRAEKPEEECNLSYQKNRDNIRYLQCMAYIQDKWDWYSRCKPIVDQQSELRKK